MYIRLAFAVAAHLEPEILLVDEVLAVGDAAFQKKCLGRMGDVAKGGRTVLFVSHQMNMIRRLCEQTVWLDAGRMREVGRTAEVVSTYEAAMTSGQLDSPEYPDATRVKARFLRWEIVEPSADQPNILNTLGPVRVRFVLQVNEQAEVFYHSLVLLSTDNQRVWGAEITPLQLNIGTYEFVYALPYLPVKPGEYNWQAILWDENGLVDFCHCYPNLIVSTIPTNYVPSERSGLLNLPFDLEINKI
jgi:lipopolysaccharide transport system ATP-binding protein